MDSAYKLKQENPKPKSNFLSKLFFIWTIPIFYIGTKRRIQLGDLYKTLCEDKSEGLGNKLEYNWDKEVERTKNKLSSKPSLLRAVFRTFRWNYLVYGILIFIQHVVLRSPQPVVLAWLIRDFESGSANDKASLYISASLLIGLSIVTIFLNHHGMFGLSAIGMRARIAISSLIYRKITRLNKRSQGQTAGGQVINLLSNDVQRIDLVSVFLHFLWIMPIQVAIVAYLMYSIIGIYCFVGIGTMIIITIPLQTYFGKLTSDLRFKVASRCDTRVKHMSEIVSGIQVIKMYAWEKPFETLIKYLREKEISSLTKSSYLRGFYASCNVFIERLTLFVTIIAYVLASNRISADIVFSMAQFFNILQLALAILYPMAISMGAEAWVAIKRLEEILILDEKEESLVEKVVDKGITLSGISAEWVPGTPILKAVDLVVPEGKLCAVIGPVGAGKSSLLQLLLGEVPPTEGSLQIGGSISYSSQEPWLFVASVRKNIMFGKPYDSTLYNKVAHVCALEQDFKQFPYGDKTMVGERGVSLSGGQRARINLARAIYRQADIYLMDDPLSAVDTHVGKHLFEKCIVEHLRGKTRILVTHQLQYLKKADIILVLNEGGVEARGTYEELVNSNLDFTKLLAAADETQDDKEKIKEAHAEDIKNRKMSIFSVAESTFDQTVRGDDAEESGGYEGSTPFKDYFKSVGSFCLLIFVFILFLLSMLACTGTDYWVAFWTSQEDIRYTSINNTVLNQSDVIFATEINQSNIKIFDRDVIFDDVVIDGTHYQLLKTDVSIYIYSALIVSAILLTTSRAMVFYKMSMKASTNIHRKMFHCLLEAPMRFFDVNPSGRVLNRFSKDMGAIDEILPRVLMDALTIILVMVGILINVSISNYFMIIAIVVLGAIFLKLRNWYIASAKDIKHLEGIAKSPMFSHINSTLNGLSTIRAAQAEKSLIKEFDEHQNVHTSAWFLTIMCIVAFGLWLDIICVLFTAIITFGFVIATEYGYIENGSLVGLAISQSLILTGMLQYGMRQTAEVINQLTSVERVLQYTQLENEGPFETPSDRKPKGTWPKAGKIEFRQMSLIYVQGEPPVLKELDFEILPGEKIGIVGRTGAGKSSLISALFRLAPIEGQIIIDGIDTKTLGLNDLRKKISIIPQEPVLFSATLRYNLDPFNEFDDKLLWNVLEEVELKDLVNNLDFQVSEGGGNFSLGQRQLLCLARALLRNNKILVLDEATANVDARTDALIQTTIRKKFKECTVLTIAHRLNTIMDSDKVLVMGAGKMLEFDHPFSLLQMPEGHFTKMVLETGTAMSEQLKDIAWHAWLEKKSKEGEDWNNGA
ncbi:multidrug resistance-associated protein 4-like [Sitophilus oryzae]|uniref:Multidrug resistance-associated protein 4-like n=1 Tax=Sitophilus oryzae TaxID=7048 RepID=A0A6J2Y7D2_SITOR|nr:multidrug resistance-associated protein 4-like [Sitophilus oryzae]